MERSAAKADLIPGESVVAAEATTHKATVPPDRGRVRGDVLHGHIRFRPWSDAALKTARDPSLRFVVFGFWRMLRGSHRSSRVWSTRSRPRIFSASVKTACKDCSRWAASFERLTTPT